MRGRRKDWRDRPFLLLFTIIFRGSFARHLRLSRLSYGALAHRLFVQTWSLTWEYFKNISFTAAAAHSYIAHIWQYPRAGAPDELLLWVITFTVLQELNDILYDTISQHNHMLSLKGKQKIKFRAVAVVVVVADDTTLNKMRWAISLKKEQIKMTKIYTVNSLYSGHYRDLGLVSSLARVRNSGKSLQSNICDLCLAGI